VIDEPFQQEMRTFSAVSAQHGVDGLQPFLSFYGVEIFELGGVSHEIGSSLAASCSAQARAAMRGDKLCTHRATMRGLASELRHKKSAPMIRFSLLWVKQTHPR
jgi:hypothetical protein